jgi:nucleotide-binding universal stress UspA family protein
MTVRTIVVGVDPSEGSGRAVRWTAELAAQLGAHVIAVHAFEPLSYLGKVSPPLDFVALRAAAAADLESTWCRPLADARLIYEPRVVDDNPVHALIDVADAVDADLIVVGARGQSTFRGIVLGSTSLKLPHETRRPVCIVHTDDVPSA